MRTRVSFVALLLAVAMSVVVWASAGSEQSAAGKVTIDFQCNGSAVNQDMYQAWIKGFTARNPDIQVNYMPFPEGGWAKVRATFAGGWSAGIRR